MKFSIIIPLYNKVKSVENTIFSVLQQCYTDFELIVIDDGSTDGSAELVEKIEDHRLTLIKQKNSGVSSARNAGVELSCGDYLVFLDADDVIADKYLIHIKSLIDKFPMAGAYGTRYAFSNMQTLRPCRIWKMGDAPQLVDDYFDVASRGDLPIIASGVCIPRKVLNIVGGFPASQQQGEDQDLWARIGLNYSIALHPAMDITYQLDTENRISLELIPDSELAYSKGLQEKLENNLIPQHLVASVKRYIGGHLLHLAQLNIKAKNFSVASDLIDDPRTRCQIKRRLKWKVMLKYYELIKNVFGTNQDLLITQSGNKSTNEDSSTGGASNVTYSSSVLHLVNDTKMGGITSSIESLGKSRVGKRFRFLLEAVRPSSWLVRNYKADVIIVHYASSWATLIPNLLLKLTNPNSKVILHEHHYTQSFENTVPSVRRFQLMLKLNYALFDKVVAVSHGQAHWVSKNGLIDKGHLAAIQQCNDLAALLDVTVREDRANEDGTKITVGAFGRLVPVKGFDTLIKAFNQIENANLKLLIGGSGPEEANLKALADGNQNIEFAGRVVDVPGFLARCDVVIIPSTSEAFGQVCVEAKAAGKAVIVSDIDGLREQVITPRDKSSRPVCGEIIAEHSVECIAKVLATIETMPLKTWGENAREDVKEDWFNYQQRWGFLLSQLCAA